MNKNFILILCSVFLTSLVLTSQIHADDWPQWRGINRDGVWKESGLLEKFPADGLKPTWEAPIGSGYCGPTVADGRVYVMDKITEPNEQERVLCFDESSGDLLWKHQYNTAYEIQFAFGPRASVTIQDGKAYSLGAMGYATCFNAETGEVIWEKDLQDEYDFNILVWGVSPSPLVYKDKVIYHISANESKCIVALNADTGKEEWRALDESGSYSSPIIIEQAGKPVLVCWTGASLSGLNPETGGTYWSHPFKPEKMVINISTPVYDGEYLFFSSFYDGSYLLRAPSDELTSELIWNRRGKNERNTDSLHSIISTPMIKGDYIYGVDSYGELRCLEKLTGDRIWENLAAVENTRWGTIHFIKNFERVWMFNEAGELIIAKLSPEGYHPISKTKLIKPTTRRVFRTGEVCWSHPAFANKHIFVRNDKKLICYDLSK